MKKMDDVIEEMKALMKKVPGIRFGFIDASLLKNQGDRESEVDITVLGGPDLVEMDEAISQVEEKLGRSFSITSFTVREFQERIKVKDEAILRALKCPKIMLLGDEDEMKAALGAQA